MHIGGLERLPKKKELWYNVSRAERTTALDMLFKRLQKMLQKRMAACSRSWFRVHVQSHKSALVMASGGCQTNNEMSAGCEICPSLNEALIWSLALFARMVVPADISSPPAEPWQELGISPDFSHRRMRERIKMAWKSINQRANLSVASLLLNESCYKQACFQYAVHANAVNVPPVAQ